MPHQDNDTAVHLSFTLLSEYMYELGNWDDVDGIIILLHEDIVN